MNCDKYVNYPPPEPNFRNLSHSVIRLVGLGLLCCLLVFSLCACGEKPPEKPLNANVETFTQTVNNIEWTVSYNSDTKSIVSIAARNGMVFGCPDEYSPFYLFMRDYKGTSASVAHTIRLSGVPLENNRFEITQVDEYVASGDIDDYEYIKKTFPACSYGETEHTEFDYATGESHTVKSGQITLHKATSQYEMEIAFTIPSD